MKLGIEKDATFVPFVIVILSLLIFNLIPSDYFRLLFESSYDILLPSVITMASTLGGIYIAVYFLTAQIRPLGVGNAALGVLYKNFSPYPVMLSVAVSLATSLVAMFGGVPANLRARLTSIAITTASYVAFSLPLVATNQLRHLDKSFLASRILRDFSLSAVRRYGLVKIEQRDGSGATIVLATNGLNYDRHDPLRAYHELVQQAIAERDRLLLGKLVGSLLKRSCEILCVAWQNDFSEVDDWRSRLTLRGRFHSVSSFEQAAIIHQLHYLVRLARNLHEQWPGLDVGRHGIQYQLAKFLACAAARRGSYVCCMATVSAIVEISRTYSDVNPYGRVEPLNSLAGSLAELERNGRTREVAYVLDALAMIQSNTNQLADLRGAPLLSALSSDHLSRLKSREKNLKAGDWSLIIIGFDPWCSKL